MKDKLHSKNAAVLRMDTLEKPMGIVADCMGCNLSLPCHRFHHMPFGYGDGGRIRRSHCSLCLAMARKDWGVIESDLAWVSVHY